MVNSKTTLDIKPHIPKREEEASKLFYHRLAKGKEKSDYMEKALDLRHYGKFFESTDIAIESTGDWRPSREAVSRSRSAKRLDSVSPIRSENGIYKPVLNGSQRYFTQAQSYVYGRNCTNARQSLRTTPDPMRSSTPISQKTTPRRDAAH